MIESKLLSLVTRKPAAKLITVSAFAEARSGAGVGDRAEHPPTFHEIRSLSLRLYAEQGVNAQALAGHKDPAMTAIYTDSRGSEWVKVS